MDEQLVFIISPPRAGSTLLQRMLAVHEDICTHPEPHLITPLVYLGYFDRVDRAPYDHINAAEAMRLFVSHLPKQEEDYLDALRAYANTLYARMLQQRGGRYFLDKTPAYALVLPFLEKLYPRARYVVLTRHPLAVMSSYANSFFDGDWQTAHDYNPILARYVPAMARFLRGTTAPFLQVNYEALVQEPDEQLKRIFAFLDIPYLAEAVEYDSAKGSSEQGPGDPINVHKKKRPDTQSVHKWARELRASRDTYDFATTLIAQLDADDLQTWGYNPQTLLEPIYENQSSSLTSVRPTLNWYTMQRRALMHLRRDVHQRAHGKILQRVRYYCDVILRDRL